MKSIALLTALISVALAAPALDTRSLSCPANNAQPHGKLSSAYITTSLLLPISKKHPDTAWPATSIAKLDAFATQGKVCNLVSDFPSLLQAPGLFTYFGFGDFTFTGYAIGAGTVAGQTTYNNQPGPGPSPPKPPPKLQPGNSYIVNSSPCEIPPEAGTATVSGSLCSKDTEFTVLQSDVVCPLGFYVVLTDVE